MVKEGCGPNVYKSCLKVFSKTPINIKCTCKLAQLEGNSLVKYSFNEAKTKLPQWIQECENENWFKSMWETFQKCKCDLR